MCFDNDLDISVFSILSGSDNINHNISQFSLSFGVVMQRVSPIVQHEVLKTGIRLYERDAQNAHNYDKIDPEQIYGILKNVWAHLIGS
ncbi:MAG: hypothetical protein OMM_11484 [Candidatus Magnetoglobus multicellularis str. Araruama]|uniref:Uncharacterized protein n=1 Tax=Candidatus Magnetoglobus multicellularis str. Araruama TaxID=890399 RepID=A0A1V1NY65_9BACT|nr:MAG: hypothetical protein OMM_11484 [Candidatus Magnetoglobus multicellularis str. Araruama]